jgi:hypothetical protein
MINPTQTTNPAPIHQPQSPGARNGPHQLEFQFTFQTKGNNKMNIYIDASDTALQRKVIEQTIKRLPYLTSGIIYTVAAILGEDFWEEDDESHRSIGQSFSHLVNNGRLPFESNGWSSNRHNEYRYTPSE